MNGPRKGGREGSTEIYVSGRDSIIISNADAHIRVRTQMLFHTHIGHEAQNKTHINNIISSRSLYCMHALTVSSKIAGSSV
jgi:hypothetical protein